MADLIWGRNPIREALKAGRKIERILIVASVKDHSPIQEIRRLAEEKGVRIEFAERERFDKFGEEHQGIVAFAAPFQYSTVDAMLDLAAGRGEPPLLVVLDSITDPQNLGALVRTVDAAGAHGVVVPRHRAVGVTAAVEKASAGAVEYVKIARVTNLARAIDDLKERGVWSVGLDALSPNELFALDFTAATAFVLGSEGRGISRLVRERCDLLARIPMRGVVSSLNVSASGAIALYEALHQRSQSRQPKADSRRT